MNPEFKVLTNQPNTKTPLIQNRFRKLTLQSPNKIKSPKPAEFPQPKIVFEENLNPVDSQQNNKSEMDIITNKLMLSTSSSNISEQQTNFIEIETEPFTNPLQLSTETTENEGAENNTLNDTIDLTQEMEKLEMSQVSRDLFSQFTQSSELQLPPNRVLSHVDNIDNISQRISSMHMTDEVDDFSQNLAPTQPKTMPRSHQTLADTQPNTSPIILSDSEDDEERQNNENNSLLTEESENEDDSVIEVGSSDSDGGFISSEDRVPKDISPINTQRSEISETVVQKLNNFFDNIPTLTASQNNYERIVNLDNARKNDRVVSEDLDNSIKPVSEHTEINISETSSEDNVDEILQLDASHMNESLDKSEKAPNVERATNVQASKLEDINRNDTLDSSSIKTNESLLLKEHCSSKKSDKSSTMETASEDLTSEMDDSNANDIPDSSHISENLEEIENSIYVAPIKKNFKVHGTSNTLTFNSPTINISAKVNINIKLSVISSSTTNSDTDASQEIDDSHHSEPSSKNNDSMSSETATHLSSNTDLIDQRKEGCMAATQPNKNYVISPNHIKNGHIDEKQLNIAESSLIYPEEDVEETLQPVEENRNSSATEQSDGSTANISLTKGEEHVDASIEIDEIGEHLLNEVYGDAWRTPQLIKKCVSTKKKCLTDVARRNRSRGFSLFRQDIPSELDSTRITPVLSDVNDKVDKDLDQDTQHTPLVSFIETDKTGDVNEGTGDQSNRILRSCRKVPANRILDYSSDEDESGSEEDGSGREDDESASDGSFQPTVSSAESDSSHDEIVVPKSTTRSKTNKQIFLDLTCQEVIEDEDHICPNASAEDLEEVSKKFLESLQNEKYVQTPAPTNKNVPVTVTKRKLFTHNYEDQPAFEETKTPVKTPVKTPTKTNDKVVHLKTPIPTYLIPPQYREKQLLTTIDGKKVNGQSTPVSKRICGFLESLDVKEIPDQYCDPDAVKFRNKFKENRQELVTRLMKIYNEHVFANKLKDVPVSWSKTLRKTAGRCYSRKIAGVRVCRVELSEKVTTTADRVRDTLIHELCHSAAWVFDGENGHGTVWKMWTDKCNRKLPELPKITRCHDYKIDYKYTYKCSVCGLRSQAQSKPKKEAICARCHGPIEVFLNQKDKDGKINLVKPKEVNGFAKFVQENYKLFKGPGRAHAGVMKILSNNFAQLTVQDKLKYKKFVQIKSGIFSPNIDSLKSQEVIEDEDHVCPNASAEDLEEVSKKYLESLQNEKYVETLAPKNKNIPATITRRKLFTHNYDDQLPFEETKTPTKTNDKVVQTKTPITTNLISPQYRERQLLTTIGSQTTSASKRIYGFLKSLDDKEIPAQYCNPDALKFRNKFKENRNELVKRLMGIFNEHVFSNKLRDVTVSWSKSLRTTAGYCYPLKKGGVRLSRVELNEKVNTTAERVRDTLIHALCHSAAWIIDGDDGNHGGVWKMWADKCIRNLPELPKITLYHNYDIDYKYTYKCTVCGLRSQAQSKPIKEAICARCHGPIEVFLNQKDKDGKINLVKPNEVNGFAKFVQENYELFKVPGRAHAGVMKILSNNFAQLTVQDKLKYKK